MADDSDDSDQPTRDFVNASGQGSAEELTRRNVARILALEAAEHGKATTADRVADAITSFCGSITFVWITVLTVGSWVVFNLTLPEPARIDPFPFPLLTLVLSVEAIFLAIFILMSQNRAARSRDVRRDKRPRPERVDRPGRRRPIPRDARGRSRSRASRVRRARRRAACRRLTRVAPAGPYNFVYPDLYG